MVGTQEGVTVIVRVDQQSPGAESRGIRSGRAKVDFKGVIAMDPDAIKAAEDQIASVQAALDEAQNVLHEAEQVERAVEEHQTEIKAVAAAAAGGVLLLIVLSLIRRRHRNRADA